MLRLDAALKTKLQNTLAPLTLQTYDGSGETTHPDIVDFHPGTFNGYRFWMVNTPYTNLDSAVENPSVWASHDGLTWVVPAGLTNPIAPKPVGASDYNSDTAMVYDPNIQKLRVYYRQSVGAQEHTRMLESSNGITWTGDANVIDHGGLDNVSPQVYIKPDGSYVMWTFRNGGCGGVFNGMYKYTSADGVTWDSGTQVNIWGYGSRRPWHFNIKPYGNRFVGVVGTHTGDCTSNQKVFLMQSTNLEGTDFFISEQPMVVPGGSQSWDSTNLYQSCLLHTPEGWRLWYTGRYDNGSVNVTKMGHILMPSLNRRTPRAAGTSLNFNGSTQYVRITHAAPINVGAVGQSYWASLWFRTPHQTTALSLLEKWFAGSGAYPLAIRTDTLGRITAKIYDGTNNPSALTNISFLDGRWHNLVFVRDTSADKLYLYVDGVMEKSVTDSTTASCVNSNDLMIGARNTSTAFYRGLLKNVRLGTGAPSPSDVAALFRKGTVPSGLVGEWLFDEGSGTTANDTSGNANNGVITGATYSTHSPFGVRSVAGTRTRTGDPLSILDTFTRADNAAALGTTESGNKVWNSVNGTWAVLSNKARVSSATSNSCVVVDSGTPDVDITVVMDTYGTGSSESAIYFRVVDVDNCFRLIRSGTSFILQRRRLAANTNLGTTTETFANGDTWRVVVRGSIIKCYLNGVLKISKADPHFNAITNHGFGGGSATGITTARFDGVAILSSRAAETRIAV